LKASLTVMALNTDHQTLKPNNIMSNKKNIYWQGKIYQGVTDEDLEVAHFHFFNIAMSGHTSYEVIGSHNFKDGQQVVEGKDYELEFQKLIIDRDKNMEKEWIRCLSSDYDSTRALKRIVAVPLQEQPMNKTAEAFIRDQMEQSHMAGQINAGCKEPSYSEAMAYVRSLPTPANNNATDIELIEASISALIFSMTLAHEKINYDQVLRELKKIKNTFHLLPAPATVGCEDYSPVTVNELSDVYWEHNSEDGVMSKEDFFKFCKIFSHTPAKVEGVEQMAEAYKIIETLAWNAARKFLIDYHSASLPPQPKTHQGEQG